MADLRRAPHLLRVDARFDQRLEASRRRVDG
jgi:hypothetical protein